MSIMEAATTFCIDPQTVLQLPRSACRLPLQATLAGQ
jgi:hypothetical protein